MRIYSLLFSFFLCGIISLRAQDFCEQQLNQASAEFSAGRFYGIPAALKDCLGRGFSTEQKVRAYLLLTQAYLLLDDPIAAEDSYLKLLKADPEYVANPARDPIDVYYLSKKFTSNAIFTPRVRIGINTSAPHSIYQINTGSKPISSNLTLKPGFQLGTGIDLNFNNHWGFSAEINYSYKAFKETNRGYSDNGADFSVITEKQNWFDIPLLIRFTTDSGTIRPYGYAGFAFNLLINAKIAAQYQDANAPYPDPASQTIPPKYITDPSKVATGQDEIISYKRNSLNRSLVLGGGIRYKVGKNFLFADVRYMLGLSNLLAPNNNYYSQSGQFDPAVARYSLTTDYFRMDNISFSVGYIKPLYNPRKKGSDMRGIRSDVKEFIGRIFKRKSK